MNHGWINILARKQRESFALINVLSSYSFSFLKERKEKENNNMMLKKEWKEQGFINEPAAEGVDLKAEIRKMCKD